MIWTPGRPARGSRSTHDPISAQSRYLKWPAQRRMPVLVSSPSCDAVLRHLAECTGRNRSGLDWKRQHPWPRGVTAPLGRPEGGPDGPPFWWPSPPLGWAAPAPRKDKYPQLAACYMQMGPSGPDVCDLGRRAPQGPGRPHDMATGDLCEPACRPGNLAGARLRVVAGWRCRRNPKGAAGQRHA